MTRFGGQFRHGLAAALLASTAVLGASPARAQQQLSIDIPAQSAAEAITNLGQQTGTQILFDHALLSRIRSHPVHGTMSVRAALAAMLKGSNFEVATSASGALIVRPRGELGNAPASAPRPATDPQSTSSLGEGDGSSADAITVTGSRIRSAPVASPMIEISQAEILKAGQSNLGEAMRALPQNFSGGQNPGVAPGTVGVSNQNITGGSSPNLRGLGSDATLTLLNGHRLSYGSFIQAVDISAIPLAAVDRIEVIPDGASAIYGSDAVAGVVNVVLKRDYDGLATSARFGAATSGGDEEQEYGFVAGKRWSSGGVLLAYDFLKGTEISARDRPYTGYMIGTNTLWPARKNHSVLLTAHQQISSFITLSLDANYNHRNQTSLIQTAVGAGYLNAPVSTTLSIAPSIKFDIIPNWNVTVSGLYGSDRTHFDQSTYSGGSVSSRALGCYCNVIKSAEISAEGKLLNLPAGHLRLATGGGYRYNSYDQYSATTGASSASGSTDSFYAFGELYVPLVSPEQSIGGLYRSSINAAVRYEKYPGRAEVVTPKIGGIYSPTPDFDLKASWGKSFKVATLLQQYQNQGLYLYPASLLGGTQFPAGSTTILSLGGNPNLKPERANSWSVTLAAHPAPVPALRIEATYFDVRYKNRIVQPIATVNLYHALSDPTFYDYVTFWPGANEQADLIASTGRPLINYVGAPYDPANVAAIVFNNYVNSSRQHIHGFDVTANYGFSLGSSGDLSLQANGSWLHSSEQIKSSAPVDQLAGVIFNPPKFKARGSIGWVKGQFTLTGYLNYTGALSDTRDATVLRVHPQASIDLSALYSVGAGSVIGGLDIALTVSNILNSRPPYASPSGGESYYVSYDSTNYSPVGRFVSLSLSKRW
jgi:outer membrane receptor protein involved in Fe transport